MEWRGREQNNSSERVAWQVRAQAAISWKASPKAAPQARAAVAVKLAVQCFLYPQFAKF